LWRVSIAEIAENAPFSTFAGIDRHFLVAIGSCVHLSIGSAERKLRRGEQASFTGEDVVAARVRETPARCLNLMTRRGFCEGGLTVRHHDGRVSLDATAVAVILLEGGAMTSDGQPLEPMQAIILGSQPEEVSFAQAVVAVVHVRRTAASAY
jgi:environmental stress-induced protein Ves